MSDSHHNAFYIKQNDTLPEIVEALLMETGPINLALAIGIEFHMRKGNEVKISAGVGVVLDAAAGIVSYAWQVGDTDTVGTYVREWEITFPSGVMTVPNDQRGYSVVITDDLA